MNEDELIEAQVARDKARRFDYMRSVTPEEHLRLTIKRLKAEIAAIDELIQEDPKAEDASRLTGLRFRRTVSLDGATEELEELRCQK